MKLDELWGKLSFKYGTTKNTMWNYLVALKAAKKIEYPLVWKEGVGTSPEIKLLEE